MILRDAVRTCFALALLVVGAAAFFPARAQTRAIDDAAYVRLGGIDQYVRIRGDNPKSPVLLFLHGGPGLSAMGLEPYFAAWEKQFIVVQWDQRGSGHTFRRNGVSGSQPLTRDRMAADGIELAALLDWRFHTKIILVGHSWGTILGLRMVRERPDLFSAFVATGLFVNRRLSDQITLRRLVEAAQVRGDTDTLAKLQQIPCGDCAARRAVAARAWATTYSPAEERRIHAAVGRMVRNGPGLSRQDAADIDAGIIFSRTQLAPLQNGYNAFDEADHLALPFFVIQGDEDVQTASPLARRYFDSVRAPLKQYIAVPGAGHYLPFYPSSLFLNALLSGCSHHGGRTLNLPRDPSRGLSRKR